MDEQRMLVVLDTNPMLRVAFLLKAADLSPADNSSDE
jgi:hypothetical protein